MMIDWQQFTLIPSMTGGLLIGLAAAILIIFNGKIAGVSGILGGLISPTAQDKIWRIAFIAGLILAPLVWQRFFALPNIEISNNTTLVALAGFIVGVGTRLGSGCTSGHGVCGISRFSKRSMVATLIFMAFGFITTYVVRHLIV